MSATMPVIFISLAIIIVSLIVALVVSGTRRQRRRLEAMAARVGGGGMRQSVSASDFSGRHQGHDYFCRFHPGSKNTPPSLTVSVRHPAPGPLVVSREGGFDRLAKNVGLAVEVQAGSDDFDRAFYLDTEHGDFYRVYFQDRERRAAVSALFAAGYPLSRIRFAADGLSAEISPFREKQLEEFPLALFLDKLALLAGGLPAATGATAPTGPVFDDAQAEAAAAKRRFIRLAASTVLLLVGGTVALVIGLTTYKPLGASLVWKSLRYSLPLYGLFLWFGYNRVKGRSASHMRFLLLLLLGLPAFLVGILGFMLFANGRFDPAPGRTYTLAVIETYVTHSKNGHNYHIVLPHWKRSGQRETLSVDRSFYDGIAAGTEVQVTVKPGYFGQEWLQRLSR